MLSILREYAAAFRAAVPAEIADWVDGGAGEEVTLEAAENAWRRWALRPRVLTGATTVDLGTELLGADFDLPVGIAPTGYQTLIHPDGELAMAAAAVATGALLVVSARASQRYADIGSVCAGRWWAQLYAMRVPEVTVGAAERAAEAGATALVLTGDAPYVGRKARRGRPIGLESRAALTNLREHLPDGVDPAVATEQDPGAGLDLVEQLTRHCALPVLVKGVLRGDDAMRCVEAGAAGVVVSNHGGRQLDRALATASALPEVVAAVGTRVPVLVDGGIRSGLDVLVALALGAKAVLVGRPPLWGLGAAGAVGVGAVLTAITDDLRHAMALAGVRRAADVDASIVTRSGETAIT